MAHADDVVLLARSRTLKDITENLIGAAERMSLEISD